ncbi:MAG: hypothetical protein MI861_16770 [Pirellulales bacterium]|nr:hypothetical protein [Pirellulales bacterium]
MNEIPALDYIRIVGIEEARAEKASLSDVTFNIEHSEDSEFSTPKRGIITLRLSELLDTSGMSRGDIERIAGTLVHEILIREKDDEGEVCIVHFLGLPLGEWLIMNSPLLRQ